MNELLEQYNYRYTGQCNCDGVPQQKYRAGDFELRVREKKDLFRIKCFGRTIVMWKPISFLEETLKQIHPHVAIQA